MIKIFDIYHLPFVRMVRFLTSPDRFTCYGWNPIKSAWDKVTSAVNTATSAAKKTASNVGDMSSYLTKKAGSAIGNSFLGNAGRFIDTVADTVGSGINKVGRNIGVAQGIEKIGDITGIHSIGSRLLNSYRKGLWGESDTVTPANTDYSGAQTASDTSAAGGSAADTAQAEALTNANNAASQGVDRATASATSSNASSGTSQSGVAGNYVNNRAQTANTNADYLNKLQQADALDVQAQNMRKGSTLATVSSALQGLGSGFMSGMSFGSDERIKENPNDGIDDNQLLDAIKKYKELYLRVHGGE